MSNEDGTDTLDGIVGGNETQAALDAGLLLADPQPIDEDTRFWSIKTPAGAAHLLIDLDVEQQKTAPHPRRKTGAVVVADAEAFVTYVGRHGTPDTEVWADVERRQLIAVINGHGIIDAGHGDHTVTLVLRHTPGWKAWLALNGQLLPQVAFAEHVEDRLVDIVDPPAGVLLEIAQTFQSKKHVDYESSHRLSDGQTVLEYREVVTSGAGKKGELAIPEAFIVALTPFRGGETYKVRARLRTRVADGVLGLGFVLDRPEEVLEAAFADVVSAVDVGLSDDPCGPIVNGWPR